MQETVSLDKVTGANIGTSPLHTVEDLDRMLAAARAAQPAWAALPVAERVKRLKQVRGYLIAHLDELATIIARDNGKTRIDALCAELLPAAFGISYYNRMAAKFLKDKPIRPSSIMMANKRSKIVRVPYGVIGVISPWNYPFAIPFSEVLMGLLAGNTVILKTATETQQVGLALKRCFEAAGLPEGVFNFINLPGRIAGEAFLEGGLDKLFFTGSVPVGKQLMQKAGETLTPVSLELGGNDAMLVCEDANLDLAVGGVLWAGFSNAGQSCGGVERIYVHRSVYQTFIDKLKVRTEALRVGYDSDFNVDMSCLTTAKQKAVVEEHVKDALAKGARIYAQSSAPEGGNFLPAMVLVDVNHEMLTMREETFGPIVGVMPVDSMDEAIKLANDSQLGLTGSVWTRDLKKGEALARRIKAGAVTVNDHLMSHGLAETPWGGFKESAIGRSHGEIGFEEMTQPQVIVKDYLIFANRGLWWHPYSKKVYMGLAGLLEALYGQGLAKRLLGAVRLARILPRILTK
ncbi:MAG: putative succinate-semialdehyde dehydrogenase (NADP(+)) 2 [Deltaproteobacteria bacterium ADurb.Bin510]|nr:MAG: putative succinate-semialdehyde dehydrogenase (NADP(+)) 2 [Deltaproteobacteria bacterium ADurb.Bin510]